MIKAVIFDYDETLVKTLDSRIRAYIDLARKEYNLTLSPEQIRKAFGTPYEDFIKTLFGDVDSVESIIRKYQSMSEDYPNVAYPGSVEAVHALLQKYLVGIVSGVRRKGLLIDMKKLHFPLDKFFYIQCGEDTLVHKPNPKVFDPLMIELSKRNIAPNETIYIGDDLRDFAAAIGAQFHFIGIANHTTDTRAFNESRATYITDFAELETLIDHLSK